MRQVASDGAAGGGAGAERDRDRGSPAPSSRRGAAACRSPRSSKYSGGITPAGATATSPIPTSTRAGSTGTPAAPTAWRMRPGSGPRRTPRSSRAASRRRPSPPPRASCSEAAPRTSTSSTCVTPSASAASWRSSDSPTSPTAAPRSSHGGVPGNDRAAPGGAARDQQHRVVRAGAGVDGEGVEPGRELLGGEPPQVVGGDRRVGGDEREHGRQVRADHADALRAAADAKVAGAGRRLLVDGVGGHDRAGEGGAPARSSAPTRPGSAASSSAMCSGSPITPVELGSDLGGLQPEMRGRGGDRGLGVGESALAGRGVGLTGVHEDGARRAGAIRSRPMHHGRRGETVRREQAGHGAAGRRPPTARGPARRSACRPAATPAARNPSG